MKQKSQKKKRETEDDTGADSIAAFIASQNLDDGISVDPESLTFAPPTSGKKKSAKKEMMGEVDKIRKRKKQDLKEEESEDDMDVDEEGEELDPEEEAELAAYLEMMEESGNAPAADHSKPSRPEKVFYNNEKAMKESLSEIRLEVPWIETMVITSKNPTFPTHDPETLKAFVQDDLKRELAFLQQALYAAEEGRAKILKLGVKFTRPEDYYAEMVKSDEHMTRIRQRLLDEQQQINASEQARQIREGKKFGKKVQVEKLMERAKQKKSAMEKVTVAKKKKGGVVGTDEDGGAGGDDDIFGVEVESGKSKEKYKPNAHKKGAKRDFKDKKFGFGGRKRNLKSNTAESTNDMSGFSTKKMKAKALSGAKKRGGGPIQKKQRRK